MTCLSIIQNVSNELSGFAYPNAVITSNDPQIKALLALLNKEGKALARRFNWQALVKEATFTTLATEIQGALTTIAPNCKYILNDTIWNRSLTMPIYGSLTAQDWSLQKGGVGIGIFPQYRLKGGNICFVQTPTAGQSCAFEYQSTLWTTNGSTFSSSFTADTDTSLLDEELLSLGLLWRWRASKGFDYAEDFAEYERAVNDAFSRDVPRQIIELSVKHKPIDHPVRDGNFTL